MTKLHDIIDEMQESGVYEDRSEYAREDLQKGYDLTAQEADDLYRLIQADFDPDLQDGIGKYDPALIVEAIVEAEHGGFDGWATEHDRITCELFVKDLIRYAKNARK